MSEQPDRLPQWTPTAVALPTPLTDVLIVLEDPDGEDPEPTVDLGYWSARLSEWRLTGGTLRPPLVTHWMPLPEPPSK